MEYQVQVETGAGHQHVTIAADYGLSFKPVCLNVTNV